MARQFRDVDDIDGVNDAVKTVSFSYGGKNWEIDLSEEHVQQFDAELAPWVRHARRAGSPPKQLPRPGSAPVSTEADWWTTPPDASADVKQEYKQLRQAIKTWGGTHGFTDLGTQGRLPRALCEKWLAEVCGGRLPEPGVVIAGAAAE